MRNKIIAVLLVIGILSIYPVWRYKSHATVFAKAILDYSSNLGEWTFGNISSDFDGKITIRNLVFKPNGYQQKLNIDSLSISTSFSFLLKSSTTELEYMLPENLSLSMNSVLLESNDTDLMNKLRDSSLWMLMAGYGGSFGCDRDSYTSFDKNTWANIIRQDQAFNLDLYYSRQVNGSVDVDLILDAENLFSTTWSSNLVSNYNDEHIIIDELIVEKLFYSYLDNGYNLKRNDACKQNYDSSFAAYRLSSAEHVQKYLRTYFYKELPTVLINLYQRMLSPDVEYNAIISLNKPNFISGIYHIDQTSLYKDATIEIATEANKYLPITLKEVDFTNVDSELLKKEIIQKEEREKQALLAKQKQIDIKNKPRVFTTASSNKSRGLPLSKLNSVIDRKIRIKTKRGRPITGYLRSIDKKLVTIETRYATGGATLTIPVDKIASVEVIR